MGRISGKGKWFHVRFACGCGATATRLRNLPSSCPIHGGLPVAPAARCMAGTYGMSAGSFLGSEMDAGKRGWA